MTFSTSLELSTDLHADAFSGDEALVSA